jgi:hypothetical protein
VAARRNWPSPGSRWALATLSAGGEGRASPPIRQLRQEPLAVGDLALDQFGVAAGARFALDLGMEEIGIVDAAGRLGDEIDPAHHRSGGAIFPSLSFEICLAF